MGETIVKGSDGTEAKIFLSRSDVEDEAYEQVKNLVNHEAFNQHIRLMPDMHWGSGATIGFTMPFNDMVCPNVVGVDIGCGMTAVKLDGVDVADWRDEVHAQQVDEDIRDAIPMGFDVHDRADYHMHEDFPWDSCIEKASTVKHDHGMALMDVEWFNGYGPHYFDELCQRVEYDPKRAIDSMGTLGGGNHFIEIAMDENTEEVWVIIHSGSRGIGYNIAHYWQDRAHDATFHRNSTVKIPFSEIRYFTHGPNYELVEEDGKRYFEVNVSDLQIDAEQVREDYEGEAIEGKFGQLKGFLNAGKQDKDDLDYLCGTEAYGYYIDMIFAQTYAMESRNQMAMAVADVLGGTIVNTVQSPHNYINFEDGIIRKGATPAHKGQDVLIPLNMKEGTLLCVGKGNEEWNYSAPHGAGRSMSRSEAERSLSIDSVHEEMDRTYSTNIPLDEAPAAYKSTSLIEDSIGETVDVMMRLIPIHNIKA